MMSKAVYKAYKFRIYPTDEQRHEIDKQINVCRFIYNLALQTKIVAYSGTKTHISNTELQRQLTDLKKEHTWIYEVASRYLTTTLNDLDKAYCNYQKGSCKFPVFKKKKSVGSISTHIEFKLNDDRLKIPKIKGLIKVKLSRKIKGEIKRCTVSRNNTGKYYASFLTKQNIESLPPNKNSVGIDFGIKKFATLSNGVEFNNHDFYKRKEKRLSVLNKRLSKKQKGSKNKNKIRVKISKIHEKIANQRNDFLHKTSTSIAKEYGIICIEDLNILGMLKNNNLSKAISDTGWNTFETMLKYKAHLYGGEIRYINRYYPSSKTCSKCGNIQDIELKQRIFICHNCGTSIDRDLNAAINIQNSGLGRPEVSVEPLKILRAKKQKV